MDMKKKYPYYYFLNNTVDYWQNFIILQNQNKSAENNRF